MVMGHDWETSMAFFGTVDKGVGRLMVSEDLANGQTWSPTSGVRPMTSVEC